MALKMIVREWQGERVAKRSDKRKAGETIMERECNSFGTELNGTKRNRKERKGKERKNVYCFFSAENRIISNGEKNSLNSKQAERMKKKNRSFCIVRETIFLYTHKHTLRSLNEQNTPFCEVMPSIGSRKREKRTKKYTYKYNQITYAFVVGIKHFDYIWFLRSLRWCVHPKIYIYKIDWMFIDDKMVNLKLDGGSVVILEVPHNLIHFPLVSRSVYRMSCRWCSLSRSVCVSVRVFYVFHFSNIRSQWTRTEEKN